MYTLYPPTSGYLTLLPTWTGVLPLLGWAGLGCWAAARLPLYWVSLDSISLPSCSSHCLAPYPSSLSLCLPLTHSLSIPPLPPHSGSPLLLLGRGFFSSFPFAQLIKAQFCAGTSCIRRFNSPARQSSLALGSTKFRACCSDWGGLSLRNPTQHHLDPQRLRPFHLPSTSTPLGLRPAIQLAPTRSIETTDDHDDRHEPRRGPRRLSRLFFLIVIHLSAPSPLVLPLLHRAKPGQSLILHDPQLIPNLGHFTTSPWPSLCSSTTRQLVLVVSDRALLSCGIFPLVVARPTRRLSPSALSTAASLHKRPAFYGTPCESPLGSSQPVDGYLPYSKKGKTQVFCSTTLCSHRPFLTPARPWCPDHCSPHLCLQLPLSPFDSNTLLPRVDRLHTL